ncbi:hypothetical protein OG875_13805 [Streptomyces sp. NBC_01498]|uniref:hypothetical protein n=1 Tax=Streptomyces sp. NBC_01498 TaxID=2975870 RepID=UPI002E7BD03E|nr:hypothetical protein [Streptomyces sp. NBC_01498]WTL25575.1 hypothetical protein OG875_13805 [Streptomyces sp. NBC_01498]
MSGSDGLTRSYWCEVRAEGEVYGTGETAAFVLGTFGTISPKLALRWLRGQAERIADGLDPDPAHSAWVESWMRVDPAPMPDCPTALRDWTDDPAEHRAARDQLAEGAPLSVVMSDSGCRYTLTVWPIVVRTPDPLAELPASGGPIHTRSGHTSHRKARRSGWLIPFL